MASAQLVRQQTAQSLNVALNVPWERLPNETTQAYARFVLYRNTDPSHRSIRKLGVSMQLAARWSKRHSWVKRAEAWDDWQMEQLDALGSRAIIRHRVKQLALGSAAVERATAAIQALDPAKVSVEDAVALGSAGVANERQALQLDVAPKPLLGSAGSGFAGLVWGGEAPAWLPQNQAQRSEAKQNETEPNGGVLLEAKVLAEDIPAEGVHALADAPDTPAINHSPARPTLNNKGKKLKVKSKR